MWRSLVLARRASLSGLNRGPNLPLQPQVLDCETLTSFSLHLSTKFSLELPNIIRNIGFVSNYSSHPISHSHDPFSDTNNVFDEMSSSISSEDHVSDETGENPTMDSIDDSGENESVVESEIYEVDLEKLENVLSLLQSSIVDDGSFEMSLESMNLTLHEEFVLRVIETPLVPGENLIGFFKWVLKKPELSITTQVVEALVRAVCNELRNAYALWDLVKELGEKEIGLLTTEILNELISLFSKLGKGKAGFEVFNKFGEFGCIPSEDSFYFTIEALCRRSIYDWAVSVIEKMVNAGKLPDSERIGKIISYMCKGQKANVGHSIYLLAKEKDRCPPQSSVKFLISWLSSKDESVYLALDMLEDFSGEERKYAIKPFSSVIQGLCRIKDTERAKALLFNMIEAGPPPGNAVFNSIINSLSKAGEMGEAMKLIEILESRGLKPDVYTYSVIMSGYAKGGEMDKACKVLAEAKKKHSKLSPVTYHTLIRGYCKLEEFDKALKLLSEMKEYGVQPNADEYNKLIQSLCLKAMDWETAERLLEEMKGNGLHLNGITKGLIRAVKELEEEKMNTQEANIEA